ncbi:MAG: ribosome silencing factor [Phycisphaerales bacterium]|nr:ribosome silencing factor [Phycisphaerales bacterium]
MAKQVKKVAKKTASAAKPSKGAPAKAAKAKAATPKKVTPKAPAKKAATAKATKPKATKPKVAKPKAGPSKVSKPKGVMIAEAKPIASPVEAAIVETAPAVAAKPVTQDVNMAFAIDAARLAHDDKCTDVVLMDVRGLSQVTDYIIVGSGSSERQMRSVLDHIQDLGATRGFNVFRTNKDERALWLLADFVHVVVHLFEPATRAHYDLEMLWGDAPRVEWERPDQMNRDRAGLKA